MAGRSVAVVGAGRCGLLASIALAEAGRAVSLIERLPAPGGQEPERPEVDALSLRAERAGVEFMLGSLAVRWRDGHLETLGVDGARAIKAEDLVVATGARPATRAELGVAGDRTAMAFPGSAALHIIESGVLLGRRPVIVGGGTLAATLVEVLREAGAAEITVVAPDGVLADGIDHADRLLCGWRPVSAHGNPRIQAVQLIDSARPESEMRVFCDALLLAHERRPMLNVEGAIGEGASVIHCHSSDDPKTAAGAECRVEIALERLLAVRAAAPKED